MLGEVKEPGDVPETLPNPSLIRGQAVPPSKGRRVS
jgi:hypothetical protein